jgi:hypothetical protein
MAPQIPGIAEKHGVKIMAGPFVNREHTTVVIVETGSPEALDNFVVATRLHQWNQVRILPSLHLQEGLKDVQEGTWLF